MPTPHYDELSESTKKLESFILEYAEGQMRLFTQPEDAHFAVLEIEYNESAYPTFNVANHPYQDIEGGQLDSYTNPSAQEDIQDAMQSWSDAQANPNIVLCGPRKLIISNFQRDGWAKAPSSFCTYTANIPAYITSATACNWYGEVIQGTVVYSNGINPGPDHPVQPTSSSSNKFAIKNDTYTISSSDNYNIEDDIQAIVKKDEKKIRFNSPRVYKNTKARIKNQNEYLKKLNYITKEGNRVIKRIGPANPNKVTETIKPRAVPNPPIAEAYGTDGGRPKINEGGTE